MGSSFGSGVPWKAAGWNRTAGRGANRNAAEAAAAASSWRSGERSSRTQKERPCVPMTRSPWRTSMSRTEQFGRFCWSACQRSPSSNDTKTPVSVPA